MAGATWTGGAIGRGQVGAAAAVSNFHEGSSCGRGGSSCGYVCAGNGGLHGTAGMQDHALALQYVADGKVRLVLAWRRVRCKGAMDAQVGVAMGGGGRVAIGHQ